MDTPPRSADDVRRLARSAERILTLARCLDQAERIEIWRRTGDHMTGVIAVDALEQAQGLLRDLATGEAERIDSLLNSLINELPPGID